MEEYGRALCSLVDLKCCTVEDIYNHIKNNKYYKYTTNENGLHSYYTGSYYHPAVIYKKHNLTLMFWLFDGEVKDYIHPFYIMQCNNSLYMSYCSSERIINDQSIANSYFRGKCYYKCYNLFRGDKILHDPNYKTGEDKEPVDDFDRSLFTPEFYPLCDEINTLKLKFAD